MRYHLSSVIVLALVCPHGHAAAAQDAAPVGTWRGTSICTNRSAAPACRDEAVAYEVRAVAGTADSVVLRADKIVNGAREFMGELPFARGTDGTWTSELVTPRVRARWSLVIRGDSMTGVLVDLPTQATVRRVALSRTAAGPGAP